MGTDLVVDCGPNAFRLGWSSLSLGTVTAHLDIKDPDSQAVSIGDGPSHTHSTLPKGRPLSNQKASRDAEGAATAQCSVWPSPTPSRPHTNTQKKTCTTSTPAHSCTSRCAASSAVPCRRHEALLTMMENGGEYCMWNVCGQRPAELTTVGAGVGVGVGVNGFLRHDTPAETNWAQGARRRVPTNHSSKRAPLTLIISRSIRQGNKFGGNQRQHVPSVANGHVRPKLNSLGQLSVARGQYPPKRANKQGNKHHIPSEMTRNGNAAAPAAPATGSSLLLYTTYELWIGAHAQPNGM